jgi:hypothetical protein
LSTALGFAPLFSSSFATAVACDVGHDTATMRGVRPVCHIIQFNYI